MQLRTAGVREAIAEQIGRPLGLDAVAAAHGIYRLVNANMANAIRRISATRGVDPRGLTMVVYGGNGPVHATAQAEELGIKTVLVPKTSPAFSALGLLLSDHVVDEMRAYITPIGRADAERVNALFAQMEHAARAVLATRHGGAQAHRAAALRQSLLSGADLRHRRADHVAQRAAHPPRARRHRRALPRVARRAAHLRLARRGADPAQRARSPPSASPTSRRSRRSAVRQSRPPVKGRRKAFFGGRFVVTPIYDGPTMRAGHRVKGPAIIEEPFTTIVLHPKQQATLDRHGNYRIEL